MIVCDYYYFCDVVVHWAIVVVCGYCVCWGDGRRRRRRRNDDCHDNVE